MSSSPPAEPADAAPAARVRRLLPATLTYRLVAVVVVLVAVVGVLIGTVTTVAMHRQLMQRLDGDVRDLARPGQSGARIGTANQGPGSLLVAIPVRRRHHEG